MFLRTFFLFGFFSLCAGSAKYDFIDHDHGRRLIPFTNICAQSLDPREGFGYIRVGSLKDENGNYFPNTNCSITFKAKSPKFNRFIITILSLELEQSENCVRDYLKFSDKSHSDVYCAKGVADHLFYSSNELKITFVSDAIIQKPGFDIIVSEGFESDCQNANMEVGNYIVSSDLLVQPRRIAFNPSKSSSCSTVIRTPSINKEDRQFGLRLEFTSFSLEYSGSNCAFDRLNLTYTPFADESGVTKTKTISFCGVKPPPVYFYVDSDSVKVEYFTDGNGISKGFTFFYTPYDTMLWDIRAPPKYFYLQDETSAPVTIDLSLGNHDKPSFIVHNQIPVKIYAFQFETVVGNHFDVTMKIAEQASPGVIALYNTRFDFITPEIIERQYIQFSSTGILKSRHTIDTFQLVILVASDSAEMPHTFQVKTGFKKEIGLSMQDMYINGQFSPKYEDFLTVPPGISTMLQSNFHLKAPANKINYYWNMLSFGLYKTVSDITCNMSGIVTFHSQKPNSTTINGPFCAGSTLPLTLLAGTEGLLVIVYYFHDQDLRERHLIARDNDTAFRFEYNQYQCTPRPLPAALKNVGHDGPSSDKPHESLTEIALTVDPIFVEECTILQTPIDGSNQMFSLMFEATEVLQVFSKFSSGIFKDFAGHTFSRENRPNLVIFSKSTCESRVTFWQERKKNCNPKAELCHLFYLNYQSNCPYSPGGWVIHIEKKCRHRVPFHRETSSRSLESVPSPIKKQCGMIETPNYPHKYSRFERSCTWVFRGNMFNSHVDHFVFHFDYFDLGTASDASLVIRERVYNISSAHRISLLLDHNRTGAVMHTISNSEIVFTFTANKVNFEEAVLQKEKIGFSISFHHGHPPHPPPLMNDCQRGWLGYADHCYKFFVRKHETLSWKDASKVCVKEGGYLVTITQSSEMEAIRYFLLYPWLQLWHVLNELNIFIGLHAEQRSLVPSTPFEMRWINGDPHVFSEWFPQDKDKIYNFASRNVAAYVSEHLRQPTMDSDARCTLMMMHNPRHAANWVRFPCFANVREPAFICERIRIRSEPPSVSDSNKLHFDAQLERIENQKSYCLNDWYDLHDKCYMLFSSSYNTWPGKDAYNFCRSQEAEMALAESRIELKNIVRMVQVWKFNPARGKIWIRSYPDSLENYQLNKLVGNRFFEFYQDGVTIIGKYSRFSHITSYAAIQPRHVLCERRKETKIKTCGRHEFKCPEKYCISVHRVCDGQTDCFESGLDEKDCDFLKDPMLYLDSSVDFNIQWNARRHYRRLFNSKSNTSHPWHTFCDFKTKGYGLNCNLPPCRQQDAKWRCNNGQCISLYKRCDGVEDDCHDNSDENNCYGFNCVNGFPCKNSGICISRTFLNDSQVDCEGLVGEDEQDNIATNFDCLGKFVSRKEQCLPGRPRCFDRKQACIYDILRERKQVCPNNEHLNYCQPHPCPGMFKCNIQDGYCLPLHYVCDGKRDCPGGVDEANCPKPISERRCPVGKLRCQGYDEDNVASVLCLDRRHVCDGKIQCPGGDDEMFCDAEACPIGCNCLGYTVNCTSSVPLNFTQLPSTTRELRLDGNKAVVELYSGIFEHMPYLGYLSMRMTGIQRLPSWLFSSNDTNTNNLIFLDLSDNEITSIESLTFYGLNSLQHLNLSGNPIQTIEMDSFYEMCALKSLDLSATNLNELPEYAFRGLANLSRLNLSRSGINKIQNNAFDFTSVTYLDLRGNNKHMIVEKSAFQTIKITRLETDHTKFCCLAPNAMECYPKMDGFSNCDDLLANTVLRVLVWILGLTAVIGNIFVLIWRCHYTRGDDNTSLHRPTPLFVVNLSVADFLMGVYLLIIGGVDVSYRGNYIIYSDSWKTSSLCSISGILAGVSSQVSITFLTFITIDRLLCIVYPMSGPRIRFRHAVLVSIFTWASWISLALALPPLLQIAYPAMYGRNSVCLSYLLTPRDSNASLHIKIISLCFILYNLLSFIFITISYANIIMTIHRSRKSAKRPIMESDYRVAKRMALLIVTDFVCWMPVILVSILTTFGGNTDPSTAAWLAVLVMPINSSLNPYLYTISMMHWHQKSRKRKKGRSHSQQLYQGNTPRTSTTTLDWNNSSPNMRGGHYIRRTSESTWRSHKDSLGENQHRLSTVTQLTEVPVFQEEVQANSNAIPAPKQTIMTVC